MPLLFLAPRTGPCGRRSSTSVSGPVRSGVCSCHGARLCPSPRPSECPAAPPVVPRRQSKPDMPPNHLPPAKTIIENALGPPRRTFNKNVTISVMDARLLGRREKLPRIERNGARPVRTAAGRDGVASGTGRRQKGGSRARNPAGPWAPSSGVYGSGLDDRSRGFISFLSEECGVWCWPGLGVGTRWIIRRFDNACSFVSELNVQLIRFRFDGGICKFVPFSSSRPS